MRTLSLLLATSILLPGAALAQTKVYPPRGSHSMGLHLAIVDDAWADDGIGVGGHYEMVLVKTAGPGHVMGGGTGLVAFLDDEDWRNTECDREETILTGAGRVRYVLGVSKVVRPYAGIGLGLYAVDREYDDCDGPDDDNDLGIGLPISLGVDFAFESFELGISFNVHETSAGDDDDEDFNHVALGIAWRF